MSQNNENLNEYYLLKNLGITKDKMSCFANDTTSNEVVCIDEQMVEKYMDMLFEYCDGGYVALRGFPDKGGQDTSQNLPFYKVDEENIHDLCIKFVKEQFECHGAAYVVPCTFKEKGNAKNENVSETQVILVDIDDGEIQRKYEHLRRHLGEPTLIVQSGGVTNEGEKKLHLYWKLSEAISGEDLETVREIREKIAIKASTDTSFKRLSQPIRIAGSIYQKNQENKLVTIQEYSNKEYELSDLLENVEDMPPLESLNAEKNPNNKNTKTKPNIDTILTQKVHKGGVDGYTRFDAITRVIYYWIWCAHKGIITVEEALENVKGYNLANVVPPKDEKWLEDEFNRILKKHCKQHGDIKNEIQTIKDAIQELNENHAVVTIGSKVRILEEFNNSREKFNKNDVRFLEKRDFITKYENRKIEIVENDKKKEIPITKLWLEHKDRRMYNNVVFSPDNNIDKKDYNLWRGFSVEPKQGDCSLYLQHIKNVICSGNKDYYDYLIKYMAHAIQKPEEKPEVAIVLKGGRGTGKGMFVNLFGELFRPHFLQISNPKHLTGNFNGHLKDKMILFVDEAYWAGDQKGESVLKTYITEEYFVIEQKGLDAYFIKNYLRIFMASNDDWVIPAGHDERRFFVLKINEERKRDFEYFKDLKNAMNEDGQAALLYYLKYDVDISDFNSRNYPQNNSLFDQKIQSLDSVGKFWYEGLNFGFNRYHEKMWETEISKDNFYDYYINFSQNIGYKRRVSKSEFFKTINKMCPEIVTKRKSIPNCNQRLYICKFPTLAQCRESFEKYLNENPGTILWTPDERDEKEDIYLYENENELSNNSDHSDGFLNDIDESLLSHKTYCASR